MQAYRVTGEFTMGRKKAPFTMEVIGKDPEMARDRVLATLGSRHRVNRYHIVVNDVKEIKGDDITDAVVEKRLSMVK